MHRISTMVLSLCCVWLAATAPLSGGEETPEASEAWIAIPASGETSTRAFAVVSNPTMYDIYLVSGKSALAGKVEFRDLSGGEAKTLSEITVPAYGSISMRPGGLHLLLSELSRPLELDETVELTLTTDGNIDLRVEATAKQE